ncbi:MAG: hypothetical protein ABJ382_17635 [Ilumatobacter sp.]
MTDHGGARCPSCDTVNAAHATYCTNCGSSMGAGAATPPSHLHATAVGAAKGAGATGYVIGASAVAAVLIVGGALLFLVDTDGSGDVRSSDSVVDVGAVGTVDGTPEPDTTLDAESDATAPPGTATPQVATTESAAVDALTTVADVPATLAATTPAPTSPVAPPVTAAPVTAAPVTAAPVVAPTPTAAPSPAPVPAPAGASALTFEQAEGFFRNYVAVAVGGDHTTAWNLLSTSDQADYPNGFDQFVGFWRSVSFADVQRVESVGGSAGFQSLAVDMAYGQADGDPTSFELVEVDVNVRPDGFLQIFDYRYIRNR